MKYLRLALLTVVVLLSVAAGAAKAMRVEQELAFFDSVGLEAWIVPLGLLQIAGALLALAPQTRQLGAWVIAIGFAASSTLILMSGQLTFGLVSLAPVVAACVVAFQARQAN